MRRAQPKSTSSHTLVPQPTPFRSQLAEGYVDKLEQALDLPGARAVVCAERVGERAVDAHGLSAEDVRAAGQRDGAAHRERVSGIDLHPASSDEQAGGPERDAQAVEAEIARGPLSAAERAAAVAGAPVRRARPVAPPRHGPPGVGGE